MKKVGVFYDPRMAADGRSFSPSGLKSMRVVKDWLEHKLPIDVMSVIPATGEQLLNAHSPGYVRGIMEGVIDNGHGNNSRAFAEAAVWSVGSIVNASRYALRHGVACSPTSGFHHASYDSNHGYCTFNGLVVAAQAMLDSPYIQRVAIVDFDFHYGDGTDDIIHRVGLGDVLFNVTNRGREILVNREIDRIITELEPDAVIYQAGADQHVEDPLGGIFTDDELIERDRAVFECCNSNGIPIVWCLAGGYRRDENDDITPVLETHRNTMIECVKQFVV